MSENGYHQGNKYVNCTAQKRPKNICWIQLNKYVIKNYGAKHFLQKIYGFILMTYPPLLRKLKRRMGRINGQKRSEKPKPKQPKHL